MTTQAHTTHETALKLAARRELARALTTGPILASLQSQIARLETELAATTR